MGLVSTGRSGGGGGGSRGVIQQFQDAQRRADEARKIQQQQLTDAIANLSAQVGGTFDQAQAQLVGLGETARERSERRGRRTLAAGQQDLIGSGLFNTTLAPNLRRAVAEDVGLEQAGIDESVRAQFASLLGQRAGSQLQIGSLLANAIQGQQVQGPDLGLFAQLLAQSQGSTAPVTAQIGASTAGLPNLADSIRSKGSGGMAGAPQTSSSGGGGGQSFGGQSAPSGGGGGGGGGAQTFRNPNAQPSRNPNSDFNFTSSGLAVRKPTFQQKLQQMFSGA